MGAAAARRHGGSRWLGAHKVRLDDQSQATAQRGGTLSVHACGATARQGGLGARSHRRTTRSLWRRLSDVCMRETPSAHAQRAGVSGRDQSYHALQGPAGVAAASAPYGTRCIRRTSKRTSSHSTTCKRESESKRVCSAYSSVVCKENCICAI